MGVVNEAVEDGVGQGWVADSLMPVFDGQLACDDGGSAAVAVFEDFQEVAALRGGEDGQAPIVDDQHIHAGNSFEDAFVPSVTTGQSEGFEHAWRALIENWPPVPARLVAKGAGDPAFAKARWTGDQKVLMPRDPGAISKMGHDTAVSRAAVQRNLAWMEARGLIREMTGQGRYRMWRTTN